MSYFTDKLDAFGRLVSNTGDSEIAPSFQEIDEARAAVVTCYEQDMACMTRLRDEASKYAIALQRMIEHAHHGETVPHPELYHHKMLVELRARAEAAEKSLADDSPDGHKVTNGQYVSMLQQRDAAIARAEAAEKLYAVSSERAAEWRAKAEAAERELARVRAVLALAVSTPFDCSGFHHSKKDRHLISEVCPIEARARAALKGMDV